ncbi:MAG: hypothetical protein NC405_07085 [Odoribacter sp.]|nr:hypothetical protein [Odoribacter sp.]
MKRYLLPLCFCLTIVANLSASITKTLVFNETKLSIETRTSMPGMVVEGRTWWYSGKQLPEMDKWPATRDEFGITIGKEVDIDGIKWNELNVTTRGVQYFDDPFQYGFSQLLLAHIREVDGNVYIRFNSEGMNSFSPIAWFRDRDRDHLTPWNIYIDREDDEERTVLMYPSYKDSNSARIGNDLNYMVFDVTKVYTVTNSGLDYTVYDSYCNALGIVKYVEGIGFLDYENYYGELLFMPFNAASAATGSRKPEKLRYVTDADGNIIYEHIGGMKLWEAATQGISDISDDSTPGIRWFNLQGISIDEPQEPGIYVKVSGNTATKVVVK